MEVLQSDALTQKSYKSHLLKARLMSLCAKYSMVPAKLHKFSITLGELKTQFNNLPVMCCFSILVICIFQLDQHHSGDYVPTVYFSGKIKSKVLHLMNPGPKVQSWVKLNLDFLGFMISALLCSWIQRKTRISCKNMRPTISPPQILQVPLEYLRIHSFEKIYLAKKSKKTLIVLKT